MIPRIKSLIPINDYRLHVRFDDGKEVIYDVKEDIEQIQSFFELANNKELFDQVQLDQSRTCVFWTDEIDLPSDAIYEYGIERQTKKIISNGLEIVPEMVEDAENIYKYMGCDSEIIKYTGWNPYQTLQSTIDKIQRDLSDTDTYSWVIKKDGEFIGTIGAYDYNSEDESIEIGYSIARKYWGNGYAGIAAKAVVDFLLYDVHMKKVRAWSRKANIASRKILTAAGFQEISEDEEQITFEKTVIAEVEE